MNQLFSFKRFSLLISKHWADNKKRYLLSVIGFALLLIVWFIFTLLVDPHSPMEKEIQILTFFFSLFGLGAFYASQYFRDLGSRSKGINFLLVPASALEKILCSILFTVVIFFSVFTAVFYLVDVLMIAISNQVLTSHEPARQQGVINIFRASMLPLDEMSTFNVLLIFFTVQSIFLLGSVYFPKYSFIKTVISGFVVFFLVFCLIYVLYEHLMPRGGYVGGSLTSYRVSRYGSGVDHLVQIPGWIDDMVYFILMYAIAPFLWVVSYYRLKEKQV
jgi:hypothetical protein